MPMRPCETRTVPGISKAKGYRGSYLLEIRSCDGTGLGAFKTTLPRRLLTFGASG